jgi:hypothetical protein
MPTSVTVTQALALWRERGVDLDALVCSPSVHRSSGAIHLPHCDTARGSWEVGRSELPLSALRDLSPCCPAQVVGLHSVAAEPCTEALDVLVSLAGAAPAFRDLGAALTALPAEPCGKDLRALAVLHSRAWLAYQELVFEDPSDDLDTFLAEWRSEAVEDFLTADQRFLDAIAKARPRALKTLRKNALKHLMPASTRDMATGLALGPALTSISQRVLVVPSCTALLEATEEVEEHHRPFLTLLNALSTPRARSALVLEPLLALWLDDLDLVHSYALLESGDDDRVVETALALLTRELALNEALVAARALEPSDG